ncbi:helix-turn-helix domain-containing protein [Ruminococcus sp. 5_1_39BFAA]|uniref:helix-turn-helix domain-containing protein n=1 Tax=Ruminococcus sp. 5_1_39BFAA TaxID=457412 RepID=UPI00356165C2
MYIDSAYWHNSRLDFKDKKHPLFVGSCGTYHLYTQNRLPTHRPRGRLDYQILYIASGKAHFYFHGKEEVISAGNMVLYRPKEEQRYYYYGVDQTEVYWVHFTGNNVKNILRKYGIADDVHVIHTGTSLEYKRLFLLMIQELKLCKEDYEEMLVSYLRELLIMIHRVILSKPRGKSFFLMNEIDAAVQYFHANYHKAISIEDYAASHNMSTSWFIRNFKEYTNATPAQYILSLRISNARTLLETTAYNVSEISNIIGYENPLYFSRIFKKQCGMSPSEFRNQMKEEAIQQNHTL